jgi:hypothetical protein
MPETFEYNKNIRAWYKQRDTAAMGYGDQSPCPVPRISVGEAVLGRDYFHGTYKTYG